MLNRLFGTLVFIPTCFGQALENANTLTVEEKQAGWELLFDGFSSKGWHSPSSARFPDGFWVIENGFLRGAAVGNRSTDLMTSGTYRNFELQFEWKIDTGGNSGVKYLVGSSQKLVFEGSGPPTIEGSGAPGPAAAFKEFTSGLEYQVVDEERHPDGKESATRSGALYQLAGFSGHVVKPAGHINQSRIVVNGNSVEHWLNGIRVVLTDVTSAEFKQMASKAPARTRRALEYLDHQERPIALQSHTGTVWFRSLKIRRLPVQPHQ
jgi:hypothetical protein